MTKRKLKRALPTILAQAEDLPTMPDVAVEILRMADREDDVGLEEFAPVLQRDPSLAVKLLRLANSSAYNAGEPVTTLEQATKLLGMHTLQTMAMSISLVDDLSKRRVASSFDFRRYWRRSLTAAVAARRLARLSARCPENEAFLCGLLASLGQLVLAISLPKLYETVLQGSPERWPSCEEEEHALGFNHSDVGAALLNQWDLPSSIYTCVGYLYRSQQLPESTPQSVRDLTTVVQMAALTTAVLDGQDRACAWIALAVLAREHDIQPRDLGQFLVELEMDLLDTAEMMGMELGEGAAHGEILSDLRRSVAELSEKHGRYWRAPFRRAQNAGPRLRRPGDSRRVDPPTGLSLRIHLDEVLEEELKRMRAGQRPQALGLLRIELDDAEGMKRSRGPTAIEALVRTFGRYLGRSFRDNDLPVYCGEAAFAVLVSRATPSALEGLAERIRQVFGDLDTEAGATISIGGACAARCDAKAGAAQLWKAAGAALALAKETGDRCEIQRELRLRAA